MTTQDLSIQLTNQIKTYLKSRNHIDSGDLLNSLQVNVDANLGMSVSGKDYLVYIDDGQFTQNFFELPTTVATIENFISRSIDIEFDGGEKTTTILD